MGVFTSIITRISKAMHWVAGITIWVIMAVTLVDVILRHFGHPIVGSFEIISFLGAIVVGLALPYTSLMKGHIYVDFLVNKFSKDRRAVLHVTTRIFGMFLFFVLGWFFFSMAWDLFIKGEVSTTFKLPFYPIAAGLGLSSFVQVFVLVCEILRTYGDAHE
jgi:TRAP-type C4-dicarboxylate transport system permease small subunit